MNEQERLSDGLEKLKKEVSYFIKNSSSATPPPQQESVLDENGHIKTEKILEQSLQPNGYVKFHSGLIIQWGRVDLAATKIQITLPISFTTVYRAFACWSALVGVNANTPVINQESLSTFMLFKQGSGAQSVNNNWFAIGY